MKMTAKVEPMPENKTSDKVDGRWQVLTYNSSNPTDSSPHVQDLSYKDAEQIVKDFNEEQDEQS